jgi:hypothetical protein
MFHQHRLHTSSLTPNRQYPAYVGPNPSIEQKSIYTLQSKPYHHFHFCKYRILLL